MSNITDEQVERAVRVMVDAGLLSMPTARAADFFTFGADETPEQAAAANEALRRADEEASREGREIVRRALAAAIGDER